MDIDALFDTSRDGTSWRDTVTGDALALCEAVEARIEETHRAPVWTKVADALSEHGVDISDASVGQYYRRRYPFLRR